MKKMFRLGAFAFLFASALVGCSSEDATEDVLGTVEDIDPITGEEVEVATIQLTEGGAENDIFLATAEGEAGGTVDGRIIFTTTEGTQRRLYVTQTLPDGSAEEFVIDGLTNKELKADGSIDLDGEATEDIDFTFTLNVPTSVEDGSIVYNFWSTTGKGDFRDSSKRLLIGVGTIEVSVGTGVNPDDVALRNFTNVQLDAPLADGGSSSFFSLLNGQPYLITSGPEFRFFWDFGYYYTGSASFSSTSNYKSAFPFIVAGFEDTTGDEDEALNNMYFAESVFDFDAITMSSDLDAIDISEDVTNENISGLDVGDVIEFIDNYGKKGLIKITDLEPGDGSAGFIQFDVKIQP